MVSRHFNPLMESKMLNEMDLNERADGILATHMRIQDKDHAKFALISIVCTYIFIFL